ncbi:uncharacterized protein LOC142349167 [Convolutriloba macropyga]|uniref:uncharacterized protein LOC142349167 n=1 Tax=Convolutriloba macropyga TaxID=536237 RepID=UPI003F52114D
MSEEEKEVSRDLLRSSHAILLCFALNDVISVENVLTSDFPLLIDLLEGREVPVILLGLKSDCRRECPQKISRIGEKVARQIGAYSYLECSAVSTENVYTVPEVVIAAWEHAQFNSNNKSKKQFKHCSIL